MKQNKNNNSGDFGLVYKALNTLTNEVYIGITTDSIRQRQWDHTERAKRGENGKFYEAISTYGEEAFEWEQIDTASNPNELASKEKEYIIEYNAQENGYNTSSGGEIQKTVYQYDRDTKELTNEFECLQDAAEEVEVKKQDISRACLSANKCLKDFYWSYYQERFKPSKDRRMKSVAQYSLEGKFINQFKSVAEASVQTEIYKSCIAKVCRGERKQTGGFIWKYV